MITIVVNENDLPAKESTFSQSLERLGTEYEIQIKLLEAEWVPPVWEHIRVYIRHPVTSAAVAYIAKKIFDIFAEWLQDAPQRRRDKKPVKLTIYGPDGKPVRDVAANSKVETGE